MLIFAWILVVITALVALVHLTENIFSPLVMATLIFLILYIIGYGRL